MGFVRKVPVHRDSNSRRRCQEISRLLTEPLVVRPVYTQQVYFEVYLQYILPLDKTSFGITSLF